MHKVLIVGEHDGKNLNPATAKCVTCAALIPDGEITIVLLGADTAGVAAQAAAVAGVKSVLRIDRPENEHPLAAIFAPQLAVLAAEYTHVFGPSTSFGKDLMPRLAGLLGTPQVSDLMAVEGAYRFKRPTYAGNAIVTVEADPARKLIATVRVASFEAAKAGAGAAIEAKTLSVALPSHTRYVGAKSGSTDRPDLQTAKRVVSGGRALGQFCRQDRSSRRRVARSRRCRICTE
jgi:electron transfer flavoprotein alpha subunit